MQILVFKTNLRLKKNIEQIIPHIEKLPGVQKWNVDRHDIDNVLRIEASGLSPREVENTLKNVGFYCEELE
jgi:hypothetical protein